MSRELFCERSNARVQLPKLFAELPYGGAQAEA